VHVEAEHGAASGIEALPQCVGNLVSDRGLALLLVPQSTCWRTARAPRTGLIVDVEDYYAAAREAMSHARRSVHILGWAWDPDTPFTPAAPGGGEPERWGPFVRALADANPRLDVRILVWKSSLPIAATQNFFPHRARACFAGSNVEFRLDSSIPLGACHHQKVIVVDDRLAFCGGCDVGPDRWDTHLHHDDDPRRHTGHGGRSSGKGFFECRHETMAVVDGEAASVLGQLFRNRWERSCGEILLPMSDQAEGYDPWPSGVAVAFKDALIGIARSEPQWGHFSEVRETERLHLASIAAAKRLIYMENQYFASPIMAEALAHRLEDPDGPEIFLVSTQHSPSWFDQMTMDRTRLLFLRRLREADKHGRLTTVCPVTPGGRSIIVHSKLSIIDDELVRIGSANLNNRSTGFDTECDLAVEAQDAAGREAIAKFRNDLIGHWIAQPAAALAAAVQAQGTVAKAILALDGGKRLPPIPQKPITAWDSFIAHAHLGDPAGPRDSWAPWMRRWELRKQLRRLSVELQRAGLESPADDLSPETV
jgi:phosphatidylserine/phosphatidylglycerophosphate/cardiolipin synthase-like enzyme